MDPVVFIAADQGQFNASAITGIKAYQHSCLADIIIPAPVLYLLPSPLRHHLQLRLQAGKFTLKVHFQPLLEYIIIVR